MKSIRILVEEIVLAPVDGDAPPGPEKREVLFERRIKCKSLKRVFTVISGL